MSRKARIVTLSFFAVIVVVTLLTFTTNTTVQAFTDYDIAFPFDEGIEWEVTSGGGYHNLNKHEGYALYGLDLERVDGQTGGSTVRVPADVMYYRLNSSPNTPQCIDLAIAQSSSTHDLFLEICHIDFEDHIKATGNGVVSTVGLFKGSVLGTVEDDPNNTCGGSCSTRHIHIAAYIGLSRNPHGGSKSPVVFATTSNFDMAPNGNEFPSSGIQNEWSDRSGLYANYPNGYPNPTPQVCYGQSYNVVIYEHINYGGACIGLNDLSSTYYVPAGVGVSSIYASPSWLNDGQGNKHELYLYTDFPYGWFIGVTTSSIPNLTKYKGGLYNDKIKSLHNHYTGANWLTEFSIADNPPLETKLHIVVEQQADLDAWRVCFNGENCQENPTGVTELYYTWPTYLEVEGPYAITVEYRRFSHDQNWANAEVIEFAYFLSHFGPYSACDGGDGVTLTSGSNCIRLIADVGDLMPVGWDNRPLVTACVLGDYTAWIYDGIRDQYGNFNGIPKVVVSGQCKQVGDNVSSVDLQSTMDPPPPVPVNPFDADAQTFALIHFDEGSGSNVSDSVGFLNGSLAGAASWISGKFNNGLFFPIPPDGSGVNFGTFDLCPMSFEVWISRPPGSLGGRIAGQLEGGGNTGQSKWLLSLTGNRPSLEIWSAGGSQVVPSYLDVPADNSWHYLMFTYDCQNTALLYLDNILVGSLATAAIWNGGATSFEVGFSENIYSCKCNIDEIRISNAVRAPEEGPQSTSTPTPTVLPTPDGTTTPAPTPTPISPPEFVVYVSTKNGFEQIFKANPDGSNPIPLAGEGSGSWTHASYPRMSPDNSQITYECYPGGDRYLCIMNADGSNKVQLYASAIYHARIVWSPDGGKLMFVATDNKAYTIEPDGSNLTEIVGWDVNYKPSAWLPDGSKILAHSAATHDIYLLNPDGSNPVNLTNQSGNDANADISPDGSTVIFSSNRSGQYEIYTMDLDGSNQTRITFTPNNEWSIYPIWSADGSKILFSSSRYSPGYWDMFTMNSDGSNILNITSTTAAEQWSDWSNFPSNPSEPTPTSTPTNAPMPTNTVTNTPTSTPSPTNTATPLPTNTPVPPMPTNTPVPPTATPLPSSNVIFLSSTSNGNTGDISFADEDIIAFDTSASAYSIYFDGSDVSITTDVNAFVLLADNSILMSFDRATTVPGISTVDDSDIVQFFPASTGNSTSGTFAMYFDGSDVGLTQNSEDIDGMGLSADGRLVISMIGSASVNGQNGIRAEDLIVFNATSLGDDTGGTFSTYFDGSDVGLTERGENVSGYWYEESSSDFYLSTSGVFFVNGLNGDPADIFICSGNTPGSSSSCSFSMFFDGSINGYGSEVIDGFFVLR